MGYMLQIVMLALEPYFKLGIFLTCVMKVVRGEGTGDNEKYFQKLSSIMVHNTSNCITYCSTIPVFAIFSFYIVDLHSQIKYYYLSTSVGFNGYHEFVIIFLKNRSNAEGNWGRGERMGAEATT